MRGEVRRCLLTRVVEEGVDEGAVSEGGSHGGDVLKVTVDERRVDERDRLELHTDEPERRGRRLKVKKRVCAESLF